MLGVKLTQANTDLVKNGRKEKTTWNSNFQSACLKVYYDW